MGLDNLVNDSDSNDSETENNNIQSTQPNKSREYIEITQKEFEHFLSNEAPYFWYEYDTDDAGEIIYETDEFMFQYPDVTLRIFSTIEKGVGVARGKGDDAIRTVIWSEQHNTPIGGRKSTYRIKTWKKNLLKKIKSLSDEWNEYVNPCPECEGWLVEREGQYGKFLGCINWKKDGSGCDYMENIGEPEEHEGKCPNCNNGYLVKREGNRGQFLGCTNWKKDNTGCNYTNQIS